jgi:SAM-dependent methyltransferase
MIEIRHTDEGTAHTRVAYDDMYAEEGVTQHWPSYYHWILDKIGAQPGKRLLDVACGTGALQQAAAQRGLAAMGVDFSIVAVRKANVFGPSAVGDAELMPFAAESFDYVTNLGSLEHLENMAAGVSEMARVLKRSGTACILVPNTFGLMWTVRHAMTHGELFDDGQPLQRYGTHTEWKLLLERNGLRVRKTLGYETHPPKTAKQWWWYIRRPYLRLSKLILWPFVPVNLASMFVFLCEKSPEAGAQ